MMTVLRKRSASAREKAVQLLALRGIGRAVGQMTLGEQTVVNGTGIQRTTNNRCGDYTTLSIDPVADCALSR